MPFDDYLSCKKSCLCRANIKILNDVFVGGTIFRIPMRVVVVLTKSIFSRQAFAVDMPAPNETQITAANFNNRYIRLVWLTSKNPFSSSITSLQTYNLAFHHRYEYVHYLFMNQLKIASSTFSNCTNVSFR